jgi:hypothetical protein
MSNSFASKKLQLFPFMTTRNYNYSVNTFEITCSLEIHFKLNGKLCFYSMISWWTGNSWRWSGCNNSLEGPYQTIRHCCCCCTTWAGPLPIVFDRGSDMETRHYSQCMNFFCYCISDNVCKILLTLLTCDFYCILNIWIGSLPLLRVL